MYMRMTFTGGQKLNEKEIKELSKDIGDSVKYSQLYLKEDGEIDTFRSWSETLNPDDEEIKTGKKKLVTPADLYLLDTDKEYIADSDIIFTKHPELKIILRGTPPTPIHDYSSIIREITAIQEKFEAALKGFDKQVEFNQKCDVHVANLGLLHINQLGFAVDYCTEALQKILNNGWRIIACCVQPDGRRPDYILGRYNPDEENCECVKF
jgi:hypothetical protein